MTPTTEAAMAAARECAIEIFADTDCYPGTRERAMLIIARHFQPLLAKAGGERDVALQKIADLERDLAEKPACDRLDAQTNAMIKGMESLAKLEKSMDNSAELTALRADLSAAKLENGRIHGRLGRFAAKWVSGLSDNLPEDETFEWLENGIKAMKLEIEQYYHAHKNFDHDILTLLSRCQNGEATCLFTAKVIEAEMDRLRVDGAAKEDALRRLVAEEDTEAEFDHNEHRANIAFARSALAPRANKGGAT